MPIAAETAASQVAGGPSTLPAGVVRNAGNPGTNAELYASQWADTQNSAPFSFAGVSTNKSGTANIQGINAEAYPSSPVKSQSKASSFGMTAQSLQESSNDGAKAEMYASSLLKTPVAAIPGSLYAQPYAGSPTTERTSSSTALTQTSKSSAEGANQTSVTASASSLPSGTNWDLARGLDRFANGSSNVSETTVAKSISQQATSTEQSKAVVDKNMSATSSPKKQQGIPVQFSTVAATASSTVMGSGSNSAATVEPKSGRSDSSAAGESSANVSVEQNSTTLTFVPTAITAPANVTPAGLPDETDVPAVTSDEHQQASFIAQAANSFAQAANVTALTNGQAPASKVQESQFQAAILGAMTPDTSYSASLKDSVLGKTGSSATGVSTQAAAKTGTSEKRSRTTFQRDSEEEAPVQNSSHSALEIKQSTAPIKTDNPVVQDSAPISIPVAEVPATVLRSAFTDHTAATDNIVNTARQDESANLLPQNNLTSPLNSVQTAHLVQQLSETELHVGIQSGQFGKIDIHTSISQSQISARIYVEHDELGKAMAGALPQLHDKLAVEHRLDAQVELYNTGSSYSSGADRQQHQQQRTPEQNGPASRDADATKPQVETMQEPVSTASSMGLDMHV
jgi:hypothetical protein